MTKTKSKSSSRTPVLDSYQEMLARGAIAHNQQQEALARKLQDLADGINAALAPKRGALLSRWLGGKAEPVRGFYIHGAVGRGKSMLMDLFFDAAPVAEKRRVHFHAFMAGVHARIHARRKEKGGGDAVRRAARELAREAMLLCFDEFQVTDIADAMILGRLFTALFEEGVTVVATSNRPPDELYKDGLQRERFLPFIELFKKHLDVVELGGGTDYRLQHLRAMKTVYVIAGGKEADGFLDSTFRELTGGAAPESREIPLLERAITASRTHGDVAWFTFAELCEAALGPQDYLEIAREFGTILLGPIPVMTREKRNEAKRLVTLIDALYEQKTKLICTAEALPHELYPSGDGSFEFQRAASRLIEMQTDRYLSAGHGEKG